MNIDFYSYSGRGGRPVNEDSLICGENYFIVSDGLGGHDNGEIASSSAVNYIAENFRSDISAQSISQLLAETDEIVRQQGKGGKATVAALFSDGDKIRIANIGDSRVYYFRKGKIIFRTKDHSVCQASVYMGEMTDDDVRKSSDRSGLFKVLGDSEPLKLPKPYDEIYPKSGDAFLICSDGFWEHLYDMEIKADLLKSENAHDWLTHMLKRLLLRSENSGDNFTAICGIIHTNETVPTTLSVSDSVPEDMPQVTEEVVLKKTLFPKNIAIILLAVIAAAAVGVIAAVILRGKNVDGVSDESLFTEYSSTFENPGGFPVVTGTDDTEEISEIPNITETEDTEGIPEIPDVTGTEDTEEIPETPDITETEDTEEVPETPDITETEDTEEISEMPDIQEASEKSETNNISALTI